MPLITAGFPDCWLRKSYLGVLNWSLSANKTGPTKMGRSPDRRVAHESLTPGVKAAGMALRCRQW
jgi:hypothetical protein